MAISGSDSHLTEDGRFDFPNLPPGRYRIAAFALGTQIERIGRIDVQVASSNVNDVDFHLDSGAGVFGSIALARGAMAANYDLRNTIIELVPGDPMSLRISANADATGRFELTRILPGHYAVKVTPPEGLYVSAIRCKSIDLTQTELDVQSGKLVPEIKATLAQGSAQIRGVVAVSLHARAGELSMPNTVLLAPDVPGPMGTGFRFTEANDKGAFEFEHLPPGHYRMYAFQELDPYQAQAPEVLRILSSHGVNVDLMPSDSKNILISPFTPNILEDRGL